MSNFPRQENRKNKGRRLSFHDWVVPTAQSTRAATSASSTWRDVVRLSPHIKHRAGRCNIFPQQIANSCVLEAKAFVFVVSLYQIRFRVCYQCLCHCVFLWTILPLKQTQIFPLLPLLQNVNFCWFWFLQFLCFLLKTLICVRFCRVGISRGLEPWRKGVLELRMSDVRRLMKLPVSLWGNGWDEKLGLHFVLITI